jgi:Na+-driven multidrug efflux pump
VATASSQIVGGVVPVIYFLGKNDSLLKLGKTRLDGKAIVKASFNGSSEFMANVSMSLVGMLYNVQLLKYAGENGVAGYGVMMYVSMIFSSIFVGYSIGVAPVVAYHFGAKNKEELKSLLAKSSKIIVCFSIGMVVFAELTAYPLTMLFVGYDGNLASLTLGGFRIFSIAFAFMGFAIFASGFFTALNDGVTSAIISFLRTAVFQVLAVMLLPLILGVAGIWTSVIVAEFMAVALSVAFLFAKRKRFGYWDL